LTVKKSESGKIKLLVLFGGQSTEHEISCLSAYSVLKNVDRRVFEVRVCGVTKNGDWQPVTGIPLEEIKDGRWTSRVTEGSGMAPALECVRWCDAVFPVMHGIMAEDGTIQGFFALNRKPCAGPGVLASAVCMDKAYTKIVLEHAGIPQAKAVIVTRGEIENGFDSVAAEVAEKLGYPCFVKPSNSGSSVGAFKVGAPSELEKCLRAAAEFDRKVLVEEYIDAQEVECAVLGNEDPVASTPGEIVSESEFYDYDDKYINGTSSTRIPAAIPEEDRETIRKLAVKAFKALDCAGMARVDFFRERKTGRILLNEVNTIPGFTDISMYGKMLAYDGIPFKELITRLVKLAIEDFEHNKRHLSR
jgi:D-alanine-D-alanine ligase